MSLRFFSKDKHFVITTNASMDAAKYVLPIEHYTWNEWNDENKHQ